MSVKEVTQDVTKLSLNEIIMQRDEQCKFRKVCENLVERCGYYEICNEKMADWPKTVQVLIEED